MCLHKIFTSKNTQNEQNEQNIFINVPTLQLLHWRSDTNVSLVEINWPAEHDAMGVHVAELGCVEKLVPRTQLWH